ncbi:MAG: tetratricopeptide repeat protein [Anaerolineae bacterium]|nr:tetratricopeptide repeat protein [Anaerolineae bacterium]
MARAIRDEHLTPADELRELLTRCEKQIPDLKGSRERAADLLCHMDRIAELWPQVEALGADLRPEAGRWETLQAAVRKHAATIVREINAGGGFAALRERHAAGSEAWWWHLDRQVRAERIRRVQRAAATLIGLAVLAAAVIFILNRLMPVDPKLQASISKRMEGERYIRESGDYVAARRAFEEAAALTPNDPEPWLWLGAAQKKLGDEAAAEQSFNHARQAAGKEIEFRLMRSQALAGAGLLAEARTDLDAVLALDPEEPRAYLYLGGILELQGDLAGAIKAMERASELAEKRNHAELTAIARYRLAMLYQIYTGQMAVPTPTPTPR